MLPRTLEPEVMDTEMEAVDYDQMDHSTVNRAFVEDLWEFAVTTSPGSINSRGNRMLDLGTGTALIPVEVLQATNYAGTLLACDLSWEMLKRATLHLRRSKLKDRILPVYCDCKQLPVANQSCDVVMSNSIVHHIPEPGFVFSEMRRVLRPGGILFVRDLLRPGSADGVEQLVQQHARSENAHQKQMFRQSLHAALTISEVRQLLADVGFSPQVVTATSDRHWTACCSGEPV